MLRDGRRREVEQLWLKDAGKVDAGKRVDRICAEAHKGDYFDDCILLLRLLYDGKQIKLGSYAAALQSVLSSVASDEGKRTVIMTELYAIGSEHDGPNMLCPVALALMADHALLPCVAGIIGTGVPVGRNSVEEFLLSSDAGKLFSRTQYNLFLVLFFKRLDDSQAFYYAEHVCRGLYESIDNLTIQVLASLPEKCRLDLDLLVELKLRGLDIRPILERAKALDGPLLGLLFAASAVQGTCAGEFMALASLFDPLRLKGFNANILKVSAAYCLLCKSGDNQSADRLMAIASTAQRQCAAPFFPPTVFCSLQRLIASLAVTETGADTGFLANEQLVVSMALFLGGGSLDLLDRCQWLCTKSTASADLFLALLGVSLKTCQRDTTGVIDMMGKLADAVRELSPTVVRMLESLGLGSEGNGELLERLSLAESTPTSLLSFIVRQLASSTVPPVVALRVMRNLLRQKNVRQSTLDFAASQMLQMLEAGELSLDGITLVLECFSTLSHLRYVSPVAVWGDIIRKNNWIAAESTCIKLQVLAVAGAGSLVSLDRDDAACISSFKPEVMEMVAFLVASITGKDSRVVSMACKCLDSFDFSLIEPILRGEMVFENLQDLDCDLIPYQADSFLSKLLTAEISAIPRQLLLGTLEASGQSDSVTPLSRGAYLSAIAASEDLTSYLELDLPGISSLPMVLRPLLLDTVWMKMEKFSPESSFLSELREKLRLPSLHLPALLAVCVATQGLIGKEEAIGYVGGASRLLKEDKEFLLAHLSGLLPPTATASASEILGHVFGGDKTRRGAYQDISNVQVAFSSLLGQKEAIAVGLVLAAHGDSTVPGDILQRCKGTTNVLEYCACLAALSAASDLDQDSLSGILRGHTQRLLQEPLDMQGTISYLLAKVARNNHRDDFAEKLKRDIAQFEKLPGIKQVALLASLVPYYDFDGLDITLLAIDKAQGRAAPWADALLSRQMLKKQALSSERSPEPSLARFTSGALAAALGLLSENRHTKALLSALSKCAHVPRGDWYVLLKDKMVLEEAVAFCKKHRASSYGVARRKAILSSSIDLLLREGLVE